MAVDWGWVSGERRVWWVREGGGRGELWALLSSLCLTSFVLALVPLIKQHSTSG